MPKLKFLLLILIPLQICCANEQHQNSDKKVARTSNPGCNAPRIVAFLSPYNDARNFTLNQATMLTHLILDIAHPNEETKLEIVYNEKEDPVEHNKYMQTIRIARQAPALKIMLNIGGEQAWPRIYSPIYEDSEKRQNFLQSIVKFMNETGLDGVNFWWQHLTNSDYSQTQIDKANFVQFLRKLRQAFDSQFQRQMVISVLGSKYHENLEDNFNFADIVKYADFVGAMSYGYLATKFDFNFASNFTGPLAPVYKTRPNEEQFVHRTMKAMACGSGEPHKVNLGIPYYGWKWGHVSNERMWPMEEKWHYTTDRTTFMYWRKIVQAQNSSEGEWDEPSKSAFHYDPVAGIYTCYENERSLRAKLAYADEYGLGGVSISAINYDDDADTQTTIIAEWRANHCRGQAKLAQKEFRCVDDSIDVVTYPVYYPLDSGWLQQRRECCEQMLANIPSSDNKDKINCSTLDSGKMPALELLNTDGMGNVVYYEFFKKCVLSAVSENVSDCCTKKDVKEECIKICDASSTMTANELGAFFERNCSVHAQESAAQCAYEIEQEINEQKIKIAYTGSFVAVAILFVLIILYFVYKKIRPADLIVTDKSVETREQLGEGQFGTVHKAIWAGRDVAVKRLKIGASNELKREFELWKNLKHQNICKIQHVTIIRNKLALIMELADKGALSEYIRQKGPSEQVGGDSSIGTEHLLEISLMVANGLQYLHSNTKRKIVHRDLACRNCLVFSQNSRKPSEHQQLQIVVKISDFGLARELECNAPYYHGAAATSCVRPNAKFLAKANDGLLSCDGIEIDECANAQFTTNLPTRNAAPECIQQQNYSPKSDIWSYGILLIELFGYGRDPWQDAGLDEVIQRIMAGHLPQMNGPDGDGGIQMPAEMAERVVRRCCVLEPEQRISVKTVINTLKRFKQRQQPMNKNE